MTDNGREQIDPALARAALYSSVFRPVAPSAGSTGLRTNGLRFRALSDARAYEARLAEDFLINTRLRRHERETELSIRSYFTDASMVMLSLIGRKESGGREIALPESAQLQMELGEALSWRRSIRNYTGDAMHLPHLAAIARSAAGVTAHAEVELQTGGQAVLKLRTAPSAGGLYPVDLRLAALHVTGLERGLYRYDPLRDSLWQTGEPGDVEALLESIDVPDEVISVRRANVVFLLLGRPWRTMRKYGDRGMRYLFLEAGAMAQNINLAVVALGYGSVDCGSIYDDEAHEALRVDGLFQALLHTVIVGSPG